MSKRLKTWGAVALLGAQGALALTMATPGVAGAAAAPRTFTCPASGHHPPMYGTVGRNGGDGPAAVEIASPCLKPEVLAAADATGMLRGHFNVPLSVKNVTTAEITFTGQFATDGTRMVPVERMDLHISYVLPAVRLMVRRPGAEPQIRVFNKRAAWTEASQGGDATPVANPAMARELLIMTKLTPFGAMWSIIDAEGHATVARENGRVVLSGTSPYDGIPVSITLDENNAPVAVRVTDGRTVYGATFANYSGTPDKMKIDWEPDYDLKFPTRIVWTKNGRSYGDFTTTRFFSNAYVVFPIPAALR
jgi:hypothetical protein